ncbi:MAG: hypothetical protein GWP17_02275 [Aquificales bacterium]|nr:hypothetical protein [Aquificales bacterium]
MSASDDDGETAVCLQMMVGGDGRLLANDDDGVNGRFIFQLSRLFLCYTCSQDNKTELIYAII